MAPISSLDPVRIVEVGPRDGLQNVKTTIPTETKIELIKRLRRTGLRTIEITSVVSPKAIPQLADCQQVLQNALVRDLLTDESLRVPVLIPNTKGLDIAIKNGVREIAVFVSATEGFSKANINASVDQGLQRAGQVARKARQEGLAVRGYISCIFADPFDGPTPPSAVLHAVQQLLDMGCYEVSLGDTLGVGVAQDVRSLISYLTQNGVPLSKLAGHFHDTYGQAISNVWQAYQSGIRVFDSSVGGLGGCPFAPGAKGNAASEDLVYLFHQAGVQTGVDLPALVETGTWISGQLSQTNASRAGAALAIKKRLNATSSKDTKEQAPLDWKVISHDQGLRIRRSGANVELLLDRPRNGNALTSSMIHQLTDYFQKAREDDTISRIALCGSGKFFCTGMDLGKGSSPVGKSQDASDSQYDRLTRLFEVIDTAPQITIACINGPSFGGGVGLAFVCDIRLAVKSAAVTLSEVKLGLCPATISKYVIREWGAAFARECMLSARPVSMQELKALGVVARLVDDNEQLADVKDEYLRRLKVAAPEASAMCKELVRLGWMDGGGETQATGIRDVFDRMMKADSESAFGLREFQAGRRNIDWDTAPKKKSQSKL